MGQWWGDKDEVQRWSPMVHPLTPSESKGGKNSPGSSKPRPGSTDEPRTAKYWSNSDPAAGRQHRTLRDGGKGWTLTPICLGLARGTDVPEWGRGEPLQIRLGGYQHQPLHIPHPPGTGLGNPKPLPPVFWESCLETGHADLGAGEMLNSKSRRTSSCSHCQFLGLSP